MNSITAAQSIDREIGHYMVNEGIGVGEMASRLNMHPNSLRSKRKGTQDWKWSEVLTLSRLTGKSVDALIGWKEEEVGEHHAVGA